MFCQIVSHSEKNPIYGFSSKAEEVPKEIKKAQKCLRLLGAFIESVACVTSIALLILSQQPLSHSYLWLSHPALLITSSLIVAFVALDISIALNILFPRLTKSISTESTVDPLKKETL